MKKLLSYTILSLLIALLAACGSEEPVSEPVEAPTEESETTEGESVEKNSDEIEEDVPEESTNGWEQQVGETVENEGGTFTLLARNDQVETQETGPMTINFPQVSTVSAELEGEIAEFLETNAIEYIQVDMEVSNSSEETITFYPSQATITTNTGEQLEPDMFLSDYIDSDFIGVVNKKGSLFYLLKDSKAEEVEWVRILISSPQDSDWNDLGEDIDFQVEF